MNQPTHVVRTVKSQGLFEGQVLRVKGYDADGYALGWVVVAVFKRSSRSGASSAAKSEAEKLNS